MRALVRLLDIRPRVVRLEMRLLRFHFPLGDGAPTVEELSAMTTEAVNLVPARVSAVAERRLFQMRVQPRVNGDDSVTVTLETLHPVSGATGSRRVANGSRCLLPVGNAAPLAGGAEWNGIPLPRTGAPTDLYLEIIPTLAPDADGKAGTSR